MMISEAAQILNLGKGYPATPGICRDSQDADWKKVTEAVHAKKKNGLPALACGYDFSFIHPFLV
jgi:2,4-dienoyl-CoA reductase-like NADH-dependent reductase (Old Yellow Enzyme family)